MLPAAGPGSPAKAHPLPPQDLRYNGTDPERNTREFPKGALVSVLMPGTAPPDGGRTIVLHTGTIELVDGRGATVRRIPFHGGPVGLGEIVTAVGDPSWILQDAGGIVLMMAALVQDRGTDLRIVAPAVRELRMASIPGVFLAGLGANARIDGTTVESWLPASGKPDTDATHDRPFILYEQGSRLDITHADIGYLGADRATAYGVSWRRGSGGEVVDSSIHHNFFGVYSWEGRNITIRGSRFHDNVFYGIDPHDRTTGVLVEDNEAWSNGTHGIIFSGEVTDGIVRRNYSHDNGGNGIMMDLGSDRNLVTANRVEHNLGDGIVLADSWDVVVSANQVSTNRVGITVRKGSVRAQLLGNRLVGNDVGVKVYDGSDDAIVQDTDVRATENGAAVLDAARVTMRGGFVDGALTGIDVRGTATLEDVEVHQADQGLLVRAGATVEGRRLSLDGARTSLSVEAGAAAHLVDSEGTGKPEPGAGESGRTNWLGLTGLAFLAAALLLHLVSRRRDPMALRRRATVRSA